MSEAVIRDLLAVIHRDGGQYVDEHGLEKACKDAHQVWAGLQQADDAVAECARLRATLRRVCAYLLTCKENNTDEWMVGLVESINCLCAAIGDSDRFIYRDTRGNGWIDRKVMP